MWILTPPLHGPLVRKLLPLDASAYTFCCGSPLCPHRPSPADQTSSRCSPRPLRACPVSSSASSLNAAAAAASSSSYRRALGGAKAVLPGMERSQSYNGQRSQGLGSPRGRPAERDLDLDLGGLGSAQGPQDDECLDMEEVRRFPFWSAQDSILEDCDCGAVKGIRSSPMHAWIIASI